MKLETFDQIYSLWQQKTHYTTVAGQLHLSESYTNNVMSAFDKHPYETVKEIFVDKLFKTHEYTAAQLSDIAEDVFSKRMKLWDAVLTHKISINRLRELIRLRKEVGHKLDNATVLSRLKWAEAVGSTKLSKPSNDLGDNIKKTKNSVVCGSKKLIQTEFDSMSDQPRVFGKAKAYPRAFPAKKVNQNKSIVEASKQQEKSASAKAVKSSKKEGKYCVLPPGRPASEFLDAKRNYIPQKGRAPYINPLSDGFAYLPAKIQELSLQRYAQDKALTDAFAEATKDMKDLTFLERYKVHFSLKERFPDVPKSRILQACGVDPSRDKELAEAMNRPDPYAEVRPLIVEIYQAYNGKAGRITIAQRLRKFGIYLCDQTVRKLMRELGLGVTR